jgi:hypothetical protein
VISKPELVPHGRAHFATTTVPVPVLKCDQVVSGLPGKSCCHGSGFSKQMQRDSESSHSPARLSLTSLAKQ